MWHHPAKNDRFLLGLRFLDKDQRCIVEVGNCGNHKFTSFDLQKNEKLIGVKGVQSTDGHL
jgi:hypothetical protein